jgi:hypothetical protein
MQRAAAAVLLLTIVGRAPAEEISFLAGASDTDDHTSGTYAWGLDYRQHLLRYLDASFGYLNEGHLPDHHRDGATVQLWATTPWSERFALSVGAGPYVYFDTVDAVNWQGYRNLHGVGAILSARLSYSLSRNWVALLDVNQIVATDVATRSLMLGAGYRLTSLLQGESESLQVADVPNEVGFFAGETTLNNLSSNKSTNFGIEYRYRVGPNFELSTGLIDEGDGAVSRHAGIMGEAWVVRDFFTRQLVTGLGIGPYAAFSRYELADGRSGASVVGLASMTVSWRFTRKLALRLTWHRAFTTDDEDRDIITAGLAWRF